MGVAELEMDHMCGARVSPTQRTQSPHSKPGKQVVRQRDFTRHQSAECTKKNVLQSLGSSFSASGEGSTYLLFSDCSPHFLVLHCPPLEVSRTALDMTVR